MPLITCPECDKQVSDRAEACPHCGYPFTSTQQPEQRAPTHGFRLPPMPANTSQRQNRASRRSSPGRILLIIGLGIFVYFYLLFDTSVPVYSDPISALRGGPGSSRVNNLGLMQDRTLGCIAGIAIAVVGTVMVLSERHKKVKPCDGADRESPYYPALYEFNPSARCHARPRSRQLILFSLGHYASS